MNNKNNKDTNNHKILYDRFMEMLYKKYPKKRQLTEELMNLLILEREAVYRRLRQEVVFQAGEIAKIAVAWNISLDEIVGVYTQHINFKLQLWNYINPSTEELNCMKAIIKWLDTIRNFSDCEYLEVTNKLPPILTAGFMGLSKLYMLRWIYQYTNEKILPFSQIQFSAEVKKLSRELCIASKKLPNIYFIWDNMLFYNLICDIRYFHSIFLITDEEKEMLKNELQALLDYLWEVATKGCWPETGKKVSIYVSHINIDTNYKYYYYSSEVKLCCVHAFGKNELYTDDASITGNFRAWMHAKKKSTIKISEVDEKSRIEFFAKQRKLIEGM